MLAAAWLTGGCTPDRELSDSELFVKYCSKCHGEDGRGDAGLLEGGQEVNLLVSRHIAAGERDFVHRRIAYGYGQMPAYIHKVDPDTLERLVEITMRLAQEPPKPTDLAEDKAHGSTASEVRVPKAGDSG